MNDLTFKAIQVILASGLFYLAFVGCFSNKTCFRLNRCYLLTALVVSLSVPFLHFTSTSSSLVQRVITLEEVVVTASQSTVVPSVQSSHWFPVFYLFVALALLLKMVVGLVSIYFIIRKSEIHTFKGQKVYVSSKNVNPFSIFRCIVISQATFADKETLSRIIIHEQSHIAQGHGIDVLCYELICAIGWINPFFWFLKKEIKSTHEYLADEKVIEQGFDLAKYFSLIFDNIMGVNVGLANNFNQSLNLKRMKMMKKKRTSFGGKMVSAFALPVVFIAVFLVTVQCKNNPDSAGGTMNIEINVTQNQDVLLNGEAVDVKDISKRLMQLKAGDLKDKEYKYIVQLEAYSGTKMELITSIKQELREANILKMNMTYK